jgi:hypothetical protein
VDLLGRSRADVAHHPDRDGERGNGASDEGAGGDDGSDELGPEGHGDRRGEKDDPWVR